MSHRKLAKFYQEMKHVIDRLTAIILIVPLLPLMGVIAMLIQWEDGGPLLFRQKRVGCDERLFTVFKFRTMIVDADQLLRRGSDARNDRITRIGKFLRRTSLDELPQLFNIVRGEMSFVGPRPVLPSMLARLSQTQRARFRVRPGITGLAQVNGRNTLPWSQRLVYDVAYVNGLNPWMDLTILGKTVLVVLFQKGVVLDRNPGEVDDLSETVELDGTETRSQAA